MLFLAFLFYLTLLLFCLFQNSYFTLFTFEFVFLRLCHRWWMFVRLLVLPLIFASFIRSISCVISSFLTFRLGRLPQLNGAVGRVPLPPPSREDSTTRVFTSVNVYGCPIASRNCRSLSLHAKCPGWRGWSDRCRRFKGVLRFIAATKVTPSQNIFALMKWESREREREGEDRGEKNLSYLPAALRLISFDKRLWTLLLFFSSFFEIYPPLKILFSSSPLHFLFSRSSHSFFVPATVPTCWWTFPPFHVLICALLPFSSVRCSCSFCRYLSRRRGSWVWYSFLLQSAHHFST